MVAGFAANGWCRFPFDSGVASWAEAARIAALRALDDPQQAHWWRYKGTWFVGVDALRNDEQGRVRGGPVLSGAALRFAQTLAPLPLHPAQVSVTRPGYPARVPDESNAAFAFRRDRDGAHLDGLHRVDPGHRRVLREPHGWILGLPLTVCAAGAAPLVVWQGSHKVLGAALCRHLGDQPPAHWPEMDLSQTYQVARREVFATCPRVEVTGRPGEAWVLHRHLLHGVAPWREGAEAAPEGRMVAYFRPQLASLADWLNLP